MPLAQLLAGFQTFPPLPTSKLGPFGLIPGGGGVHSRTLWFSPTNSPMRLGVSSTATTPTSFSVRGFEALFPSAGTLGLHGLSQSPVVPPGLFACKCGTTRSTCHCLAMTSLFFPSLSLLLVWMNVSSFTPWLLEFHTV